MKVLGRVASVAAVAVLAVGALAFAGDKGVAQGKVTAVSDKAVTLAVDGGAVLEFQVSQGARVYGSGASHKSRMLSSSGKKTTLSEFVREGQQPAWLLGEGTRISWFTDAAARARPRGSASPFTRSNLSAGGAPSPGGARRSSTCRVPAPRLRWS
jgi:hypothetical protein